ncbi:hypothetical protein RN001_015476 [Aquatica leii]|uniref:Protein-lysine N-methyltransferase RN001_015476 n=1 Tax=Aquatica leii TaxID=1421715 RepID=A0AAN7NZ37_9COLE|nr:hypothetical protein RN001_015476 [Aquatica leii]
MSQTDDDDIPQLSFETFVALQEFYKEQNAKELSVQSDDTIIDEDWQLSQFWYDEATKNALVKIATARVKPNGRIALISCPTLYNKLKDTNEVKVFEYDKRFLKVCGDDFIQYDYKSPLDVPRDMANSFDLVIADPPFLSDECLTKTAVTVRFLSKRDVVLCTGATMSDLAHRLLGLEKSAFKPSHHNNLANDFCCYSNFDVDDLIR